MPFSYSGQSGFMSASSSIFHIANTRDWLQAKQDGESYQCASLESESFIHCCESQQLAGVVQRYYEGVDDLILLMIDPDKLTAALIRENTVGGSELFPHVYGPLDLAAIVSAIDFNIGSTERMAIEDSSE